MRFSLTVFFVGLALVASGCADQTTFGRQSAPDAMRVSASKPETLTFELDWALLAVPANPGHDHKNRTQHLNRSTPNWEILGYDPLISDYYGRTAGEYACGSARERDGRTISVAESFLTDVAFVINDVTDVRNPKRLGELVMAYTQVYDITLTPDLNYVLLATSPVDGGQNDSHGDDRAPIRLEPPAPRVVKFRDFCSGEEHVVRGPEAGLPYAAGIVMVDIRNPLNPVVVDFWLWPVWGHSVRAHEIDGRKLVLLTSLNYVHEGGYFVIMEIREDLPPGPRLVPLSVIPSADPDGTVHGWPYVTNPYFGQEEGAPASGHDGFIAKHPVTGQVLLYLANGAAGLQIYNIDDPRFPRLISQWKDWDRHLGNRTSPNIYMHDGEPMEDVWEDGRHYSFFGEECHIHRKTMPSCLRFLLDTTDPMDPQFVGAWTLPVDPVPNKRWDYSLDWSTHHAGIDQDRKMLFVTLWHGGVWAVDVSTPTNRFFQPSIGAFLPTLESPKPPRPTHATGNPWSDFVNELAYRTPMVTDLDVLSDGTLVIWDHTSGLYTVRFDEANPAPAPPPWPLGYNEV